METKKELMWLFIIAILVCIVGWIYINRSENSLQSAMAWRQPGRDNGPRFPMGERPDFTSMLNEDAEPAAGWAERTAAAHYGSQERPTVGTVTYAVTPGKENQTQQVARVGSNSSGYGKSSSYSNPRSYGNSGSGNYSVGTSNANNSVSELGSAGEELAAYLPKQTRAEQKALNQKLKNLSTGLSRAIETALSPKSKREQNIEKYLPKEQQEAQAAQVAQSVEQELSKQTSNVVNSIGKAYGKEAAQKASKIMSDFKKEMSQTLNKPGTALEKQAAANKVNNKYNQKLEKLTEDESVKKLRAQLAAENEAYLKKVSEVYGKDVANALRPVMDEYASKRFNILTTAQSDAEAAAQEAALQESTRKAQEAILRKQATGSTGDLTSLQNEVTRQRILEMAQQEEEGTYSSPVFYESAAAKAEREAAWKKEGEQIVAGFSNLGANAQQEAQTLVNDLMTYRSKLRQEAQEKGMTQAQVAALDMKKTEDTNQHLMDLRVSSAEQLYNRSYEEQYNQLPENIKSQARSVWQRYNQERAALLRTPMKESEYQQRMQQIEKQEQQQLQAVFQNAQ